MVPIGHSQTTPNLGTVAWIGILFSSLCLEAGAQGTIDKTLTTPQDTFKAYTNGYDSKDYERFVRSHSLSMKKVLLLSAIQGASLYFEDEFVETCEKTDIEFDEILKSSTGTDSLINQLITVPNIDRFIADLFVICDTSHKDDDKYRHRLIELTQDGHRAQGVHVLTIGEKLAEPESIFFRKYCGRWTVCTEDEWNAPSTLISLDAIDSR